MTEMQRRMLGILIIVFCICLATASVAKIVEIIMRLYGAQ